MIEVKEEIKVSIPISRFEELKEAEITLTTIKNMLQSEVGVYESTLRALLGLPKKEGDV